jgi:phosphate transport system permease protein
VVALLALLLAGASEYFVAETLERFETTSGTFYGVERERGGREWGEPALLVDRGAAVGGLAWVPLTELVSREVPPDLLLVDSRRYGHIYGRLLGIRTPGAKLVIEGGEPRSFLRSWIERKNVERHALIEFEEGEWRAVNRDLEELREEFRAVARDETLAEERRVLLQDRLRRFKLAREREYARLAERYAELRERVERERIVLLDSEGQMIELPLSDVVGAHFVNRIEGMEALTLALGRFAQFVSEGPSAGGGRGGVLPAIFGTALMVFLMSVFVTPLGVLAAVYLREYARQGMVTRLLRLAINNLAGTPSIVFGVFGLGFFVYSAGASIDQLFYRDALPAPTFGTGGLLWTSLTLALLTVPVVIVATDEGLKAVPHGVREGALALGATRYESVTRVVLPAAAPGVLTGLILAIARAAGEVAPLMIVGLVNAAPRLPVDDRFPFVHLERKFMHLGMQVYEGGFQSAGGSGGMSGVFASAALLVLIVLVMNIAALALRHHLRRRYAGSHM